MVKTIVTSDMAKHIAEHYGVETNDVLTGFKFIGEQIGLLEQNGRVDDYVFGFEESYGFLTGSYVRDKDAVNGAFMICEMLAWYKTHGVNLLERLEKLYQTYGYCMNTLYLYTFEGSSGFEKMQEIMKTLRQGVNSIGGKPVEVCLDYATGLDNLPKSNVLKYLLAGKASVVVRPSGTEPKLKIYISVISKNREEAQAAEALIYSDLTDRMNAFRHK